MVNEELLLVKKLTCEARGNHAYVEVNGRHGDIIQRGPSTKHASSNPEKSYDV